MDSFTDVKEKVIVVRYLSRFFFIPEEDVNGNFESCITRLTDGVWRFFKHCCNDVKNR